MVSNSQKEDPPDPSKIKDLIEAADRIPGLALKAGVAYIGIRATKHWTGALTGLVALRLANSPNLAAGAAGVGTLAALGIVAEKGLPPIFDPDKTPQEKLNNYANWTLADWLQSMGTGGFLKILYP